MDATSSQGIPGPILLMGLILLIALCLILAAMVIKGAIDITSNASKGRAARIDAAVFDALLPEQVREQISTLPTMQAKHEALAQEYVRLLPQQSETQAEETIKYYLTRHGASVNVSRSELRRQGGYSGYTDDGGAFVPLYAGDFGGGGDGHHDDGGGFFDGNGFGGDGGGD